MAKKLELDDIGYKELAAAIVAHAIIEYKDSTLALKRLGLPESEIEKMSERARMKYFDARRRYCGTDPEALKKAKAKLCRESRRAYKYMNDVRSIKDCEKFFRSRWFEMLTDLDGEYVISQVKRGAILRGRDRSL